MSEADIATHTVKLWDLPVRVCHWSFVALIPAMWWTAENNAMGWHQRLGILLLTLLLFRLFWGIVGSSTARFSSFVRGPRAVVAYFLSLGTHHAPVVGHNPAGGWSVIALLGAMAIQVGLGLFSGDPFDGATGPLNGLVGTIVADRLTDLHELVFYVLLGLILLHVVAIVLYLTVKRDNLVRPMIGGSRTGMSSAKGMRAVPAWRAGLCALVAVAISGWIWNGAPWF